MGPLSITGSHTVLHGYMGTVRVHAASCGIPLMLSQLSGVCDTAGVCHCRSGWNGTACAQALHCRVLHIGFNCVLLYRWCRRMPPWPSPPPSQAMVAAPVCPAPCVQGPQPCSAAGDHGRYGVHASGDLGAGFGFPKLRLAWCRPRLLRPRRTL